MAVHLRLKSKPAPSGARGVPPAQGIAMPPASPPAPVDLDDLYARAALACYAEALASKDRDQIDLLLDAGAWFARLGRTSGAG